MKIIDPHLHLFNLEQGDYHWLKADKPPFWPDKAVINKTFAEADLTLTSPLELAGFIHIEAGFDNHKPWRELDALEQSCRKPFRAIANIDLTLTSVNFTQTLNQLINCQSFTGVRHILDEQALSLLTNKQVLDNIKTLNVHGMVFELQLPLTKHESVTALCDVISDNRNLHFIVNHAGFAPADIHTIEWQRWQSNLVKLSCYPHVAIKCSGWEMTDRQYQTDWLTINLTLIFKIFGTKRIMLASNFPLCLFSHKSYQDYWLSIINSVFFQSLNRQEKSALCYDNALTWYAFQPAKTR